MHHKFGWNTQGVYLCGAKTLEKRANGIRKWYRTIYIAPLWYTKWRNSKFSTSPESSLKLLKARESVGSAVRSSMVMALAAYTFNLLSNRKLIISDFSSQFARPPIF